MDGAVFSPRTTLLFKPASAHTFRASFNRAFRSPSLVNNSLDITVVTPVTLPVVGLIAFPTRAVGDPDLEPETLTAYELGYSGILQNRAVVSAAVYWNRTNDAIRFTPVAAYSASNPPPGWPLPPQFVPSGALPSRYTYVNLGTVKNKGLELGVDAAVNRAVTAFANYSYQWKPAVNFAAPFTVNDVNWPAKNRVNAGFGVNDRRYLGTLSVSFTDEAYWQDVLDARFVEQPTGFIECGETVQVLAYRHQQKHEGNENRRVPSRLVGETAQVDDVGALRCPISLEFHQVRETHSQ
jgi:outer membrane receptor protein involved in Fe transport